MSVYLLMAGEVQVFKVTDLISAASLDRYNVMRFDSFPVKKWFTTIWTEPVLFYGYFIVSGILFPVSFTVFLRSFCPIFL